MKKIISLAIISGVCIFFAFFFGLYLIKTNSQNVPNQPTIVQTTNEHNNTPFNDKTNTSDAEKKDDQYWTLPEIKYVIPISENKTKTIIIPSVSFDKEKRIHGEINWENYSEGVFNTLHKVTYGGVIDCGVDDKLIDLMQLKKGYMIADVGAGQSSYVFKFSQMVGNTGKVYTTDLAPNSKHFIEWKIKLLNNGFFEQVGYEQGDYRCHNVICIVNTRSNINLPSEKFDWLFFNQVHYWNIVCNSNEDKRYLELFAKSTIRALKKDGKVLITEHIYPDGPHGISFDNLDIRLQKFGFKIIKKIKEINTNPKEKGWGRMIYVLKRQ